jgi:hypothetical protein
MEHDKRQPDTFEQINVMAQAPKRDYFLPASIIIAAILIGGAILFATFYKGGSAVPNAPTAGAGNQGAGQPSSAFAAAMKLGPTDVALGSANAPVTIIEYGDYQCPYCAMFFSNTQPALVANYVTTGKAKFVFRNFVVNDRTAQNHESHNAALAVAIRASSGSSTTPCISWRPRTRRRTLRPQRTTAI